MNQKLQLPRPLLNSLLLLDQADAEKILEDNTDLSEDTRKRLERAKGNPVYALILGLQNPEESAFILEHFAELDKILAPEQAPLVLQYLHQYRPDLFEIFNTPDGVAYLQQQLRNFQKIIESYR